METINEILTNLENRRSKGQGIAHFQTYLDAIGNPQKDLVCIHIAGTNGKGSTLNYLRSILQNAGYRVGTFSSPYLETHFDRIRINDEPIKEETFLSYYQRDHERWFAYDLGSFEIDTALAFSYFKDSHCDFCIIEAGIGGRYDCTNCITPLLSIITNIGMDHMEQLGDTLEQIAWQKAGIIKRDIPLISAEQHPACRQVFQEVCEQQHAEMMLIQEATQVNIQQDQISFLYKNLSIHLTGARYQIANSACAIEAALCLRERYGVHIPSQTIQNGIADAFWKGRFERVWQDPLVIVDGAHNEEGIQALLASLQSFPSVRILFSALRDKDTHRMMELLVASCNDITVTQFPFYRVKSAKELAETYPVTIDEDYRHAIETALAIKTSPLIITGSLYFISEVRAYFQAKAAKS